MADAGQIIEIDVDQLDLDFSNPRHEKMTNANDVIAYLLSKEKVMDLVEDISETGMTNPMDLIGVVERKGAGGRKTYVAAEGNRRVCAILLLHDPEKVPHNYTGRTKLIKKLERLSHKSRLSDKMNVCLFKSMKGAKPWIERMHNSESKAARRRWRPDQQDRAIGGGRNRDAMAIMDLAQHLGLIDQSEREAKLTTVQRYVGNPAFRSSFGLFREADKKLSVVRDPDDFRQLFENFIADTRAGKLSSRSSAKDVAKYAAEKVIECGVSNETVQPSRPLSEVFSTSEKNTKQNSKDQEEDVGASGTDQLRPKPPSLRKSIGFNSDVVAALEEVEAHKLSSLYRSCCSAQLYSNGPLITVGWWSILESLSQLHGGNSFQGYLSKDLISKLLPGISKEARNEIWNALQYISQHGNSTKHSARAASFDGQHVANCVDLINPLLVSLLRSLPNT